MATISENLEALKTAKANIKSAIEGKGQDLTNVPFTQYGEKIADIKTEPNLTTKTITQNGTYNASADGVDGYSSVEVDIPILDVSTTTATESDVREGKEFFNASGEKVTGTYVDMLQQRVDATNSCSYLFYKYTGDNVDYIKDLDTSNVTDMRYMFSGCTKLTNINLNNLNTSNVTNMTRMLEGCQVLAKFDFTNLDTSKVTNMSYMFKNCNYANSGQGSTIEVINLDTSKVTNMSYMFSGLEDSTSYQYKNNYATKIILGDKFTTKSVTNLNYAFSYYHSLYTIVGVIDLINKPSVSGIFANVSSLQNVTLKNIQTSLQIGGGTSTGTLLTLDTLLNTIKELWTNTGTSTLTLTMSTTSKTKLADVYVKLIDITDEMRAEDEYIDNKAPFVQCESTDEGAMLVTEYVTTIKKWTLA